MNQFFLLKGIYTQLQFIIVWGCRNGKRKVESEKQWEYIPFKLTRIAMEKLLVSVCRTRKVWSFFIIKPTRCTIFPNLFWHETLHVSGSSSAHHQEFRCLQTYMTYTSAEFTVNKLLMMGRGTLCQNKFVKLVHLIRFIIKKLLRCTFRWTEQKKIWWSLK